LNLCYLLIVFIGTCPDSIEDDRAKDEISSDYRVHTLFKNTGKGSQKPTLFYCRFNRDIHPL
jgi:hypothetical protein